MSSLHFDGYYATGPMDREDWQGGVRMVGVRFHFTRYYPNGEWLQADRDHDFAFWEFTETVTPELFADAKGHRAPEIGEADPLCTAGNYTIRNGIVIRMHAPDWSGGHSWETRYRILDDRLVSAAGDASKSAWLFHPRPIS